MNKIIFILLSLILSLKHISALIPQSTQINKRGFSYESFLKAEKKGKPKLSDSIKPEKKETFKSSLTFVNRKPKDSYFPLEKDKPALVFRMTWAF